PAPVLAPLPDDRIAPLLGAYRAPGGRTAYVVRQRSRVAVQFPEGEVVLRWPNPDGRWPFDAIDGRTVEFTRDVEGRVSGLIVAGGGSTLRMPREPRSPGLPDADGFARLRHEKQGGDGLDRLMSLELTGTLLLNGAPGTFTMASSRDDRTRSRVVVGAI